MAKVVTPCLFACVLGLLAIFAIGAPQINAQPKKGKVLRFAWPSPVLFKVEESVRKGETSMILLHTLSLQTNRNELLLRWKDAQVDSINGLKVDSPEKRKLTEPLRAMYLATPPFRISQKGYFLGTVNLDESIEESSRQLDRLFPERSQEQREDFLRVLNNPAMKQLLEQIYSEYWKDWVENWSEIELRNSDEIEAIIDVSLSPGTQAVPMKLRLKNLGPTPTNAALFRLQSECSSDDSKTLQGTKGFIDSLAKEIPGGRPLDTNGVSKLRISIKRETVTDPSKILPYWGKRERVVEFFDAGEFRRTREVHEYRFFWEGPN